MARTRRPARPPNAEGPPILSGPSAAVIDDLGSSAGERSPLRSQQFAGFEWQDRPAMAAPRHRVRRGRGRFAILEPASQSGSIAFLVPFVDEAAHPSVRIAARTAGGASSLNPHRCH